MLNHNLILLPRFRSAIRPPCTLCCNGSASIAINGFSCALGPLQVGIQSTTSGTTITWGSGALYNLCNGTYTVYVDFQGGQTCGAYLVCYPMYLSATKLDEKLKANISSIKLFPNPATDILSVSAENDFTQIKIINNLGQVIYEEDFISKDKNAVLKIKDLPTGIYILNLINNKSESASKRFVISR